MGFGLSSNNFGLHSLGIDFGIFSLNDDEMQYGFLLYKQTPPKGLQYFYLTLFKFKLGFTLHAHRFQLSRLK